HFKLKFSHGLLVALNDQKACVRRSAYGTLTNICEKAATIKVIGRLVAAVVDWGMNVRIIAAGGLEMICDLLNYAPTLDVGTESLGSMNIRTSCDHDG
ncbi:unnamed protein product, partial [Rotaria socialis]